jgi:holo-[acyl-carrier protein] synthase
VGRVSFSISCFRVFVADLIAAMSTILGLGLRRIFTDGEMAYCQRRRVPAIHFAGRFAAKEAAMKALGTGHSRGVLWRDVEVVRRGGPPQLVLHGGAGRRFDEMGGRSSLLTITHSDELALAEVLILGQ